MDPQDQLNASTLPTAMDGSESIERSIKYPYFNLVIMDSKAYIKYADELFRTIEDKLEEFEEEIDYDRTSDKLEATIESTGKKIVVNTQRAIHEIWLAGNSRGWHFQYDEDKTCWFAMAEKVEFYSCLSELLSRNLGRQVSFK
jgi:CyaY protein